MEEKRHKDRPAGPGPRSGELLALKEKHVARGISASIPVFVRAAHGALVEDVDGREWIDFTGGIGVTTFGHSHPAVVSAVREQAEKFIHTCFMVAMYEPYVGVARELNRITPGDFPKKTALFNSGAEAVENAVKIARRSTGKTGIVALECAFHGRTLLAMTLTSKVKPYKYGFGPFAPEVYKIPAPYCYRCRFNLRYPDCGLQCARYLEHFFAAECPPETVAALIAEPLLGEGGFILPPPGYFELLQQICRRHGVLLIADEVQCGFYRTGYRFTCDYHRIAPDLVTMGKAIAGGLPLSAVTGRAEIMDAPGAGEIGGTYGGNPVACAAARAVLELMEKEQAGAAARRVGEITRGRLLEMEQKYALVGEVRGLGAMQAVELVKDRATKEPAPEAARALAARCHRRGLMIITAGLYGNVVRMLMPVNISEEQLRRGLDLFEEALCEQQQEEEN